MYFSKTALQLITGIENTKDEYKHHPNISKRKESIKEFWMINQVQEALSWFRKMNSINCQNYASSNVSGLNCSKGTIPV